MSIVVGFVPTPAGEAALTAGIAEARLRQQDLLIVNSAREGALVDKSVASSAVLDDAANRARTAGVKAEVIQPPYQYDLADEFLDIAREADAPSSSSACGTGARLANSSSAATPSGSSCRPTDPSLP